MKVLIKHFILIALLIIHTSTTSVMAAQMLMIDLSLNTSSSANLSVEKNINQENKSLTKATNIQSIEKTTQSPCPYHANMNSFDEDTSTCKDCSNCKCVNVISSLPIFSYSFIDRRANSTHEVSSLTNIFPDSPPSFILRPPIS